MGKLEKLSKKKAAAKKAKAAADAAAAADATAAAAAAIAAADTATDVASCAAAAAVIPATSSGSGIATCRSYAAAVADGPAVAGVTTSINATTVASPSSAVTRSSKKPKLSAAVVVPAAMADCTGNVIVPPTLDLLTKEHKKKSPKKRGDFADPPDLLTKEHKKKSPKKRGNFSDPVGRGATDASILSKSRYPSRGNAGRKTLTAVGASTHPVAEKDAHTNVPAQKKAATAKKNVKL